MDIKNGLIWEQPTEIIVEIVQYITKPPDLDHLMQVNKKLYNISNLDIFWQKICDNHPFANKITEMKVTNKLTWKENFKLINKMIIKDYCSGKQYEPLHDVTLMQLHGNGKCYFNMPESSRITNDETVKSAFNIEYYKTFEMFNVAKLNSELSKYFIVDFSSYGALTLLLTSCGKIFEFFIPMKKTGYPFNTPTLINLPLMPKDKIIKLISTTYGNFVIVQQEFGYNKLFVLAWINCFDNPNNDPVISDSINKPALLKISKKYNIIDIDLDTPLNLYYTQNETILHINIDIDDIMSEINLNDLINRLTNRLTNE